MTMESKVTAQFFPEGSTDAQSAHEDIAEGIDRMADEGGGVVDQNFPAGAPILRNDLVRPGSLN